MLMIATEKGTVVTTRAVTALSTAARIGGWMFRAKPHDDEALYIPACSSVHTCFVRFPIDVLFLDEEGRVLAMRPSVPPWRAVACTGAYAVLELAAGRAGSLGISVGERLVLATG